MPTNCPECGATWITVSAQGSEEATKNGIRLALQQCGAHLHISQAGQLRICSKSLDEIRFEETRSEETKESL